MTRLRKFRKYEFEPESRLEGYGADWTRPSSYDDAIVKPGATGPEVEDWQRNLNAIGFEVPISGVFDDGVTWGATASFKESVGLHADGVVDAEAGEAMGRRLDAMNLSIPGKRGYSLKRTLEQPLKIIGTIPSWIWVGLALTAGTLYWMDQQPGRRSMAGRRRRR